MTTLAIVTSWVLRLAASAIPLQTLFFKFSGAEESVYIFTKVGMEPWGRIGGGAAELVSAALLLWPGTVVHGAILGLVVISGAILSHLTVLGIEVMDDRGLLFGLAVAVFLCCAAVLAIHHKEIPLIGDKF